MKKLQGDKQGVFDKSVLTHFIYQLFPVAIQRALFTVKDKLTLGELAKHAVEFMDTMPKKPTISNIHRDPAIQQVREMVSSVLLQMAELKERFDRQPQPRSSLLILGNHGHTARTPTDTLATFFTTTSQFW